MKTKDVISGRAISIKQPFVEEILLGIKKYEYRSRPTKIRGRVYLYASLKPRLDGNWKKLKMNPSDAPTGVIVGSVEIVDCVYFENNEIYGYKLKHPKRYTKYLVPKNQPQPCFFFPFGKLKSKQLDESVKKVRKFNKTLRKLGIKNRLPSTRKSVKKILQKIKK